MNELNFDVNSPLAAFSDIDVTSGIEQQRPASSLRSDMNLVKIAREICRFLSFLQNIQVASPEPPQTTPTAPESAEMAQKEGEKNSPVSVEARKLVPLMSIRPNIVPSKDKMMQLHMNAAATTEYRIPKVQN